MRPLDRDGQTLGVGRLGTVRLLRLAFALFLGLRLHLLCTLHGLPLGWALTGAKADEREVLLDILTATPALTSRTWSKVTIIGDKNYYGRDFEHTLADTGV